MEHLLAGTVIESINFFLFRNYELCMNMYRYFNCNFNLKFKYTTPQAFSFYYYRVKIKFYLSIYLSICPLRGQIGECVVKVTVVLCNVLF